MCRGINILSIALIYCGTVFGAGFASGQEIFQFFSVHGTWGIGASVFVGFLFSVVGWIVCGAAKRYELAGGADYFHFLFPEKTAKAISVLCSLFLIVTFCIMITGCGTLAQEQLGTRPLTGALLSLILCFWIMKYRVKGLAVLNAVLTPFLFCGVITFCILIFREGIMPMVTKSNGASAVISGLLYISYNVVSAVAVLVPAGKTAACEQDAKMGGILGGVLVGIPLVLMTACLSRFPEAKSFQMPFFSLVCRTHQMLAPTCAMLLFGAMLTTAASAGVSVLAKVSETCSKRRSFLLCASALSCAWIPFDVLVGFLYTLFGVLGVILLIGILKSVFRK
ncbi:MAG: hypothetical protein IJC78_06055 [Clostridia bacterium]|nr:hypothetical protein [Clostridia bacterium]